MRNNLTPTNTPSKTIVFILLIFFAVRSNAHILGMQYGRPYYIQAGDGRGYLAQYGDHFILSNGHRTQFVFEPVTQSTDEVFIKVLPGGKYLCAFPNGHITIKDKAESWERFRVTVDHWDKYSFQSHHQSYLMANLQNMSFTLSPNKSYWEKFSIISVYNNRGADENGFKADGLHEKTGDRFNPRGYNNKMLDKDGLPEIRLPGRQHNDYLERQEQYWNFLRNNPELSPHSTPNIYIIILDTLRADFVDAKIAPNLFKFRNENIHTEIALSGATTTNPSLFSLYSSRPSYEFYSSLASELTLGSMPLNIFKHKMGYHIKLTGVKDMGCLDVRPPKPYFSLLPESYLAITELRFGLKTHLIEDCSQTGFIGNEEFAFGDATKINEEGFKHLLKQSKSSPKSKTIFMAHLQGAHSPYDYEKEDEFHKGIFSLESARRYASTLRKADRLFGDFIHKLKSENLYKNALIVVMGDHGEVLLGDPNTQGEHGSFPIDKAQTRIPLYFKFPDDDNSKFSKITKVSTLADVFPTIFDYLGILTPQMENFFTGRSIRNLKTHVVPIVRVNPDNVMTFFAYPYRLNVKYRPEDYKGTYSMTHLNNLSADDFEVETLENFNDQSIKLSKEVQINPDHLANFNQLFPELFKLYQDKLTR